MTGRRAAAGLLAAVLAAAATACGSEPDRTLDPDPPAVSYAPLKQSLRDARLAVDPDSEAARWQRRHGAGWLDPIAGAPQARWVNSPQDVATLPVYLAAARRQGAVPVVVAYWIVNRGCARNREGAPTAADYDRWTGELARVLTGTRAVIVFEPDAIPADCFDAARAELIARSVRRLSSAGLAVYLDAGHSRWKPSGETADRLIAAGIADAEGFAVNVSNRQTTKDSVAWARELSDLVGGRPFVVDVSRNGIGAPPEDPGRDDEWCNPDHQALGTPPTTRTGQPGVDALLWVKRPGESDGLCGGEKSYFFSPRQARALIARSPAVPAAARSAAAAAEAPPAASTPST